MFGEGKPLSFQRPIVRVAFVVALSYVGAYVLFQDRWLLMGSAYLLYLAPTFVAALRERHRVAPVVLVNVIFGWTIIGWIVALIWATTGETRSERLATVATRR